ncbi:GNAT family N-acetyltransferase [Jeotgalibacillus proteolyticus]|uniref:GNAT family N-acetyltransferase n=1 Tax=Jeotgalibacillus proteolyticus TaxID=2082395 RepID=A0A2S5GCA4_9BACL|nr:GNAT family N-acetyltransferase [Jeotgalibacillus proteolyticus]PPA70662.1 GNAT family N-acetyltransferase [Jeotgalibacillus proteolyticus]
MVYIETERLLLRSWKEEDLKPFRLMNEDKEVMRYFPKSLSKKETDLFYQVIAAEFGETGFGLYAAEEKETKEFIGFIGFHRAVFSADFTPCIEIGWRLKKDAWGKGYATEGASACLNYGFNELGFRDIYSFTARVNEPSINVMKKIGMTFQGSFSHPKVEEGSVLKEHVLYHVEKQ